MNMKLQEIIWEVTTKCDKGCEYCGSKEFLNQKEDPKDIYQIAKQIAEYPPKEVNLSGGEPGCLDPEVLHKCLTILKDAGIKTKVITNGKIFDNIHAKSMKLIDVFGLSVNTLDDVDLCMTAIFNPLAKADKNFGAYRQKFEEYADKITIVTNFGNHNIWDFDEIANYASNFGAWQVQLTEGQYLLNEKGIEFLYDQLDDLDSERTVMADNLQYDHKCMAGMYGCGILFDGEVIPCLSMRCWADKMEEAGNLLDEGATLKDIWELGFRNRRFDDENSCCRDCIKYPEEREQKKNIIEVPWYDGKGGGTHVPMFPDDMPVVMYAVSTPVYGAYYPGDNDTKFVYGIVDQYSVTVEGTVSTDDPETTTSSSASFYENLIDAHCKNCDCKPEDDCCKKGKGKKGKKRKK